ncbi:unnamed protein product [Sympodiomycopsis kandeliae]
MPKRQRTASSPTSASATALEFPLCNALPPRRTHTDAYHNSLLLKSNDSHDGPQRSSSQIGNELLQWYKTVATERGMPWRKAWINPESPEYQDGEQAQTKLRRDLEKRAYEVWISEIMLQQTRVATVIAYWEKWMAKWPTIQDLADASPDDVLSAWRGLGYYSRATRIHQAAQKVVKDENMQGLLPTTAAELEKQVPGVGRYTAGAISSIVFGKAEAILDGNVARVLSRQLGLYANPKNKATTDFLWQVAQGLVEAVAGFSQSDVGRSSEKPSLWNQALMELGSTVCTPQQSKCGECPIRSTCRAYGEGERLAIAKGQMKSNSAIFQQQPEDKKTPSEIDIEDLCQRCESVVSIEGDDLQDSDAEESDVDSASTAGQKRKASTSKSANGQTRVEKKAANGRQQSSLLSHFAKKAQDAKTGQQGQVQEDLNSSVKETKTGTLSSSALQTVQSHVRLFPMKVVKAKVKEQECLVCAVQIVGASKSSSQWLLQQRPSKGLLASLWEFPTHTLAQAETKQSQRKKEAIKYVESLPQIENLEAKLSCKGEVGQIDHVFSHLKLKMWIWRFVLDLNDDSKDIDAEGQADETHQKRKWATTSQVEEESMGTGMRNCWALVQEAAKWK